MTWAVWLAVPVGATVVAALLAWWHGLRSRRPVRLDTPEAMQAHRDYLDALAVPARGTQRVAPRTPSE